MTKTTFASNNINNGGINMTTSRLNKMNELSREIATITGINFESNNIFIHQNHTKPAELKHMFDLNCNMMVLVNKQENIINIIYKDNHKYFYKSFRNNILSYEETLKDRKQVNQMIDSFYDQLQWDDFYIINGILYEARTIKINANQAKTHSTISVEDNWEDVLASYNSGKRIKYTDGETTTIVVGSLISIYMYGRLVSEKSMLKSICLDKIRQMYDSNKCKYVSTLEY